MFEKERLKIEIYAPRLYMNQCYECQGIGHRSTFCKRMNKCGRIIRRIVQNVAENEDVRRKTIKKHLLAGWQCYSSHEHFHQ